MGLLSVPRTAGQMGVEVPSDNESDRKHQGTGSDSLS
jgi:hypothetical protein